MMDPVSIALSLLLKNPGVATAMQGAMAPRAVDVAKMQSSVADLSRGVLKCYHHSARFHSTDVLQAPWARQSQYAADNSLVVKINYSGISMARYTMVVAVMRKGNSVRTAVLADSAAVPYSKRCAMEEWAN